MIHHCGRAHVDFLTQPVRTYLVRFALSITMNHEKSAENKIGLSFRMTYNLFPILEKWSIQHRLFILALPSTS